MTQELSSYPKRWRCCPGCSELRLMVRCPLSVSCFFFFLSLSFSSLLFVLFRFFPLLSSLSGYVFCFVFFSSLSHFFPNYFFLFRFFPLLSSLSGYSSSSVSFSSLSYMVISLVPIFLILFLIWFYVLFLFSLLLSSLSVYTFPSDSFSSPFLYLIIPFIPILSPPLFLTC